MMGATYPTKKALKESIGKPLRFEETSMFGEEYRENGAFCVCGGRSSIGRVLDCESEDVGS